PELIAVPVVAEQGPSLIARGARFPWLRKPASVAHTWLRVRPGIRSIVPRTIEFARRHGVEAIWCLLEGRHTIAAAVPLAKALQLPLLTQVFDPPMYALDAHYADGMTARAVIRDFARAIRMSERCATASWHMAAEYHRAYGIETVPVVPSL